MGFLRRRTVYKVGDHVSALKNNNALNRYYPGQIVKIHELPSVRETHWNAEKSIVLHLLLHSLSCFLFYSPNLLYDVKYDDGTIDLELSPNFIRELADSSAGF